VCECDGYGCAHTCCGCVVCRLRRFVRGVAFDLRQWRRYSKQLTRLARILRGRPAPPDPAPLGLSELLEDSSMDFEAIIQRRCAEALAAQVDDEMMESFESRRARRERVGLRSIRGGKA
jgi:hypothetical protein